MPFQYSGTYHRCASTFRECRKVADLKKTLQGRPKQLVKQPVIEKVRAVAQDAIFDLDSNPSYIPTIYAELTRTMPNMQVLFG